MKPSNQTIFELFEKERRYLVPLFQRPYVWTEERQWRPLWEDVAQKADECLRGDEQEGAIRNHFLGAVVLNSVRTFGKQVTASEIIDGQQRLTTLQILLIALSNYAVSSGNGQFKLTLDRLTINSCEMKDEYERYKVWPTAADQPIYEDLFTAGSLEAVTAKYPKVKVKYTRSKYLPRSPLIEAYLYFYGTIQTYVQLDSLEEQATELIGMHTPEDRLDALRFAVTKHLEVVVIELEEKDDPQVIFETLNARGEPLLPSDLVRNFVFFEATRTHENPTKLYASHWQQFDGVGGTCFWKELERQGRMNRPRLDLFLFHFLTEQTGKELSITHLFQEFRTWWKQQQHKSVEVGLAMLRDYSQLYHHLYPIETHSRLDVFAKRLQLLDTSTVYPLMLRILHKSPGHAMSADEDGILTDLESYLIRRMICGLTPKNYNRVFLSLLHGLDGASKTTRIEIQRKLLGLVGDSARWPNDEEFSNCFRENPVYKTIPSARVEMVLQAIELQLDTSKQEQLSIQGRLSIEHIMPQHPSQSTRSSSIDEGEEDEAASCVHTFGNLTLLTQSLNSSISNGPFAAKRPEIAKQSKILLNAYFQGIGNDHVWSAESIKERGNFLANVALKVWPRPKPE